MRNNFLVRGWPLFGVALLFATRLSAFVPLVDGSGIYVVKWETTPITMQVKLSASQRSSVVAAMNTWNALLSPVQFVPQISSPGSHSENGVSEIVMDSTIEGDAFPSGVLAVTLRTGKGNALTESDIIFNTHYTWDSYRGPLRSGVPDLQRVAIHELGHVLGLDHPDEHGQSVTAIMRSTISDIETPQTDDIQGVQTLYGVPGFVPSNDNLAGAIAIALPEGATEVTGSNLNATHETGEPRHANLAGAHSVWWKWTASANGNTVVTTLGSNFDTVLAVYTGTDLASFTAVASNDDEETPEQNTTPRRKRTSKVSFSAVNGTTYYIAVDGWADDTSLHRGYTGSITLNLNFVVLVPPVFTAHPRDQTVVAGNPAYFSANAGGRPTPDFQWQRAGADGIWSDLQDNGSYGGTRTRDLRVDSLSSMDGDQLRCIATSIAGTVTSNVAVLRVTPIPLPVIASAPESARLFTGVSAELGVVATGATRYQWYRNNAPVTGQTAARLTFANPQPSDAGEYFVVVSNASGSVTSATVTVTVGPAPVITTTAPTRQLVAVGTTISFSITATGTGTLHYQWYHEGRPIAGAQTATYSARIKSAADAGAYWIAVTDDIGTLHGAPSFVILSRPRSNVVAWGRDGSHELDIPGTMADIVALSAGPSYCLALRAGGTVQGFGYLDSYYGAGILPADLTDVVKIAGGYLCSAALKSDGTVVAVNYANRVPANLTKVWAIACADRVVYAIRTDGTVVAWGSGPSTVPPGLKNVVAVDTNGDNAIALKADGTLASLLIGQSGPIPLGPAAGGLRNVAAISGAGEFLFAMRTDGTVVNCSAYATDPAPRSSGIVNAIGLSSAYGRALVLRSDGTVTAWLPGFDSTAATSVPPGLTGAFAVSMSDTGSYVLRELVSDQPLLLTRQPTNATVFYAGMAMELSTYGTSTRTAFPTYQWQRNGANVPGATDSILRFAAVQPADTGVYTAVLTSGGESVTTEPAILAIGGIPALVKIVGAAALVGENIRHPSGNIFDQLLLNGPAASFGADFGQVTRVSFLDLNGDIVQVELSGPGTVSLVLDGSSGPGPAEKYNQPGIGYMKGHAGLVVSGATWDTNLSVFSVGGGNATNQALFRPGESYDGVADIAFIAIDGGLFGSLFLGNTHFFATRGITGILAPNTRFYGSVYLYDISAQDAARPYLVIGSCSDVRVTGGSLLQANGRAVQVAGLDRLLFTAGVDSHARPFPAQKNHARLEQNGVDVTQQIVVNPTP